MGRTTDRLSALYAGRHLRTTVALATTSAAAGALTGIVGIGVPGTAAAHDKPTPQRHVAPVTHHSHPATSPPASVFTHAAPVRSHSASPSASPTPTHTRSATPTPPQSSPPTTPTTPPPTTSPTGAGPPPASASPPA